MGTVEDWWAEITIRRSGGQTRADARLLTSGGAHLLGHGIARRSPHDPDDADIGDETSAARALADLAHILAGSAGAELADLTHQPARIRV